MIRSGLISLILAVLGSPSFLFASDSIVLPAATLAIQAPKHEIGFACLKEVQDDDCLSPFTGMNDQGAVVKNRRPPPPWAKKPDGSVPSREEWARLRMSEFSHEALGFAVFAVRATTRPMTLELRSADGGLRVWVPIDQVRSFEPVEAAPFCRITGANWWNRLYRDDLVTVAGFDPRKEWRAEKDARSPVRGAIGVLQVRRNDQSQICTKSGCISADIPAPPGLGPARLNLGSEHFLGARLPEDDGGWGDYLVVFGQRKAPSGSGPEYQLQVSVLSNPRAWVTVPPSLSPGVRFLEAGSEKGRRALQEESLAGPSAKEGDQAQSVRLSEIGLQKLQHRWKDGRLWLKVRIGEGQDPFGGCDADAAKKPPLGEFWVPYSPEIQACPRGC